MHIPQIRLESYNRQRAPRSYAFHGLRRQVVAHCADEVLPALEAVASEVARGRHAAGYLAYEAAAGLDSVYAVHPPGALPLVWFGIYDVRTEATPDGAESGTYRLSDWRPASSREAYDRAIRRIRAYIEAGDTYQVNHTIRMQARFAGDPFAFYRDLCRSQRASYCAYLDLGRHKILSASPELFFSLEGDRLTTRPMKGTRPRGRWALEDADLARALKEAEKDRAENLMIVDLLRNDLGRVSRTGTVSVPALWDVERYETVWQMTSTVTSRLAAGTGLSQLLAALFPCGSVTGAPKVRTMEIIAELESSPRGVYTGSIGYISPGPEMAFNVAIRTVWIDGHTGTAEFGVGGGITHDSSVAGEYEECMVKARVLTARRPAFDLLETLRHDSDRGYFLLDRHLDRLASSAAYFGFRCDRAEVQSALLSAAEALPVGRHRVRLTLSPSGGTEVSHVELPAADGPLRVALCRCPVDRHDALLYHKTTHRHTYESRLDAFDGCDDVILMNERGELTECGIGNLVLQAGPDRLTPPVECGLLPGTLRAELLDRGVLKERVLTEADLHGADAVYLVNSVREWVPLTLVTEPHSAEDDTDALRRSSRLAAAATHGDV